MIDEQIYKKISTYCKSDNLVGVDKMLLSPGLDLLYNEGLYFKLAIKHSNFSILDKLISYYINNINEEKQSLEYNKKMYDLKLVIEDSKDMFEIKGSIQEVFDKYFLDSDDSETDIDLSDEEHFYHSPEEHPDLKPKLTEESLRQLEDSYLLGEEYETAQ